MIIYVYNVKQIRNYTNSDSLLVYQQLISTLVQKHLDSLLIKLFRSRPLHMPQREDADLYASGFSHQNPTQLLYYSSQVWPSPILISVFLGLVIKEHRWK